MNQKYKDKYEELRNNDTSNHQNTEFQSSEIIYDTYDEPSIIRTITFEWLDGRMLFLNYSYLVSCEFSASDQENSIVLNYTSQKVTIVGHQLKEIFVNISSNKIRTLRQSNPRYHDLDQTIFINEISVFELK
jgi:hypothetical protein